MPKVKMIRRFKIDDEIDRLQKLVDRWGAKYEKAFERNPKAKQTLHKLMYKFTQAQKKLNYKFEVRSEMVKIVNGDYDQED